MRVSRRGELGDLRRVDRRERLLVRRVLDRDHLGDAGNCGGLGGQRGRIGGEHGDVYRRTGDLARAGDGLGRAGIQLRAVMLGDDEDLAAHQTNPFCFSAPTSSATSLTMMPFERAGGGSTLTVLNAPPSATPKSASDFTSSGFFFAFMMSGSFT